MLMTHTDIGLHIFRCRRFNTVFNCCKKLYVGNPGLDENMLKLNPSKTELMTIGNLTHRKKSLSYFPSRTSEPKFCRNRLYTKPGCGF